MQFSRNVDTILKQSGLPKKVFADFVGLHHTTIDRILSRKRMRAQYDPSLHTVTHIAEASNVSVNDLLHGNVDVVVVNNG